MLGSETMKMLLAWTEYYVKVEIYDRQFPGRWSEHDDECWSPSVEYGFLCTDHARRTLQDVGWKYGVVMKMCDRERQQALDMGYKVRVEFVNRGGLP